MVGRGALQWRLHLRVDLAVVHHERDNSRDAHVGECTHDERANDANGNVALRPNSLFGASSDDVKANVGIETVCVW